MRLASRRSGALGRSGACIRTARMPCAPFAFGLALQNRPQPCERAMKRNLDRIGLRIEDLSNLSRRQVGAEAERDQLLISVGELGERRGKAQPANAVILEAGYPDLG